MNKMTKGAIATGIGVALLLGGGGTLAVWNIDHKVEGGTIAAGQLDLKAEPGKWTSNRKTGSIDSIGAYRVVPNETLTYTQEITPTIVGDAMKASLSLTKDETSNFVAATYAVSTVIRDTADKEVENLTFSKSDSGEQFTAVTTFEFKDATGRQSMDATYDFSEVSYVLTQTAPVVSAAG